MIFDQTQTIATEEPPVQAWPPEVNMILSAMDMTGPAGQELRQSKRMAYRVWAQLRLFADAVDNSPWTLYTRDADSRGIGFITPHRLPLGYGGIVEIVTPRGQTAHIDCTVYRCRQAVPGWYEGALYFNREQWMFTGENA